MSVQAIAWVLDHSQSTNTARCVLIAIANHMGGDGSGWVYVERVCHEANCSLKSYHRAVQWAIDEGELERVQHAGGGERTHVRHRPNLFRFPALSERPSQIGYQGGSQSDQYPGGQIDHVNNGAVSRAVSRAKKDVVVTADSTVVFDAWCEATGRDRARTRLTKDRLKKINERLGEGFDIDDLVAAVRGVALSPFHMGENERKQRYDDIVTVLRDGSQVEKFRDLYFSGPVKNSPKGFDAILAAVDRFEGG
jgi:hypothetical protein